jgi:hypothetical protein
MAQSERSEVDLMLRIRVAWGNITNGPAVSTFYTTGSVQSDANTATTAVASLMTSLQPYIVSGGNWTLQTSVEVIDPSTGQVTGLLTSPATTGNGSDANDLLPFAAQGLVQLHTGVIINGRELVGRVFLPGATEQRNTNGAPNSTYRAAISGAFQTYASNLVNAVVYSRTHQQMHNIVTVTSSPKWAILTSRRD